MDFLEGIRCPAKSDWKSRNTSRLFSAPSRLVSALREPCSSRFPSGVPARRAERRLAMATATKRIAAGHAEVSQLAVPALTAARREHRCECARIRSGVRPRTPPAVLRTKRHAAEQPGYESFVPGVRPRPARQARPVMGAPPPNRGARSLRNRSLGLHASCPGCRMRFTPDLASYLPACPVCGEPLQSLAGTDQAVGLRLFSLDDIRSPDDTQPPPDALAVSMPDPDH
jgi:hypothetical protein